MKSSGGCQSSQLCGCFPDGEEYRSLSCLVCRERGLGSMRLAVAKERLDSKLDGEG